MCNLHLFMKENLCRFLEFILTLCCEISARACFGYHLFHLRMAVQIIFQTVLHIVLAGTTLTPSGRFFTMLLIRSG